MRHLRISRRYQRGYAAIPYIASYFTTAATAAGASAATAATVGAVGTAATSAAALYAGSKVLQPKMPTFSTPAIPTLDQAAQQRQIQDRILRRRGVLANIYAGNATGGAPTVGTAKLLGG